MPSVGVPTRIASDSEGVKLGTASDIRENSGLQRMGTAFAPHLAGGQAVELVIDERGEAREDFRGPLSQFDQMRRDSAGHRLGHSPHYAAGPEASWFLNPRANDAGATSVNWTSCLSVMLLRRQSSLPGR